MFWVAFGHESESPELLSDLGWPPSSPTLLRTRLGTHRPSHLSQATGQNSHKASPHARGREIGTIFQWEKLLSHRATSMGTERWEEFRPTL